VKKIDFLDMVVSKFLELHPRWALIRRKNQGLSRYLGLEVPGKVLLLIDFSCRPDNMRVHHGVGWSPNMTVFVEGHKAVSSYPKPRDGSLQRLRRLERPRDFEYDEMNVSIGLLNKPTDGFDISMEAAESIQAIMLQEINELAFPYLCMMLKARHGIDVTPSELANLVA
jgi:hypothetical protein